MTWGPSHLGGRASCACEECGPGPGIDYEGHRRARMRLVIERNAARLAELLGQDDLDPSERDELDVLLYLHAYAE